MTGYRDDDRPPWYRSERKRDWLMLLAMAVVVVVLYQVTTTEKAIASAGTLFLLYAQVTVFWECHRERWFWATIGIFGLIHFVVIALAAFTFPKGPAISYVFPIMMIDGFAMFGILKWLSFRLSRTRSDGSSRRLS